MTFNYYHEEYGELEVTLAGYATYEAPSIDGPGSQEEFFFDVFDADGDRIDCEEFYNDFVEIAREMK